MPLKIKLNELLWVFFLLVQAATVFAQIERAEITGDYYDETGLFNGKIVYRIDGTACKNILFFHLPPNFYREYDDRETYVLDNIKGEATLVPRNDIKTLKSYRKENVYLPKGIYIRSVSYNEKAISFTISDNFELKPLRSGKQTLLSIELPNHRQREDRLSIEFETEFKALPEGWKRLLWDFAPRPVMHKADMPDFSDRLNESIPTSMEITYHPNIEKHKAGNIAKKFKQQDKMSKFTLLLDEWDVTSDDFRLSVNMKGIEDKISLLQDRLRNIFQVFSDERLNITSINQYKFVIWTGPLSVSGSYVLLPYNLFRYHALFQKLFEISMIKGIVISSLMHHYIIDVRKFPWIMPAIYAEFIRYYFQRSYNSDHRYFPWMDWINPDLYQENTLNNWLSAKSISKPISAAAPLDMQYYDNLYHPWYEKGFHLLRIIRTSETDFRTEMYPRINELLKNNKSFNQITPEKFFSFFAPTPAMNKRGKEWLSAKGKVDYGIKNVDIQPSANGFFRINLEIESFGTIQPIFELEFTYANNIKETTTIANGAGKYTFYVSKSPVQIYLDPDLHLLEDNLLNNSWNIPLKIRPFWDFSSANRWLFTYYPMADGNTFDKNLLGFRFLLSYMEQTGVMVDFWKRSKDQKVLVESNVFHKGFPWKGTTLYLRSIQLQATNRILLGVEQEYGEKDTFAKADFFIWNETLQEIENAPPPDGQEAWIGMELAGNFTLAESAFSSWKTKLYTNYSENKDKLKLKYSQSGINQRIEWLLESYELQFGLIGDTSTGTVPLHKQFPMGGPEGLPGFPRDTDLLFQRRMILRTGVKFPSLFENTRINLMETIWFERIVPTVNYHWGEAWKNDWEQGENFQDVELNLEIWGELFHKYDGWFSLGVAQPIGHKKYKDTRFIAFSSWVF